MRPQIVSSTVMIALAALLSSCGGDVAAPAAPSAPVASASTTLTLDTGALPQAVAEASFHIAPLELPEPAAGGLMAGPHRQALASGMERLASRGLTPARLGRALKANLTPMASGTVVATYTPAQIRAAYNLPPLPASGASLSAAQAAQLGAGQTIYIVDAMHDPNIVAELAAFNQKFGLPACTNATIAPNASLPLAAAGTSGCSFARVYSTKAGAMSASAPAYDAGWATEIALDVEWAHATAPLARIVLIEAGDSSLDNLGGAVKLANAMGPGIVSMSFGTPEGSWTASVDAMFGAANMTYLAATGDSGAAVSWPAVSPRVLAVGGTSLSYNGLGARSEVSWSGTGGGVSQYTATPAYQSNTVPGLGTLGHRGVADVAFNADPKTGQYLAVMAPGASTVSWLSAGGTSISTPQWAGLIALANAGRALAAKPALGAPHALLYGQIASVPGNYASAFADVTKGSDGLCASCSAKAGYDLLSGLGTPNGGSLLTMLTGAAPAVQAPVVSPASISGKAGTPLSFTVGVAAGSGASLVLSLSGAPAGMAIANNGVVTWAAPVAGSYAVTVTARDSASGLSGQAVISITIAAPQAPMLTSATISGKPGVALSYAVTVNAANPLTFSLSAAPAGMVISSTGVLSWPNPVAGTYAVTVQAKDSKTGLTGSALLTIKIATGGPVISATALNGVAGRPLSGSITISDPGATSLSISIAGAPLGMGFGASGTTVYLSWPSPVQGSYTLLVTVQDGAGMTAKAQLPVTIAAR